MYFPMSQCEINVNSTENKSAHGGSVGFHYHFTAGLANIYNSDNSVSSHNHANVKECTKCGTFSSLVTKNSKTIREDERY